MANTDEAPEQLEDEEEEPEIEKPKSLGPSGNSFTEVVRFLCFSIITVVVILNQLNISETYAIEQGITNDILSADNFAKISNATDIVKWIDSYLVPKVMELDFYPNNQKLYKNTQARVAWFNIMTTSFRMVQKRMNIEENPSDRNKDQVPYAWEKLEMNIFEKDQPGEMTDSYGPTMIFIFNDKIGVDESGGYIQNMNTTIVEENLRQFKKALDFLADNNWVDRQTYALYIDFSTYNGHIGMLSYIRILIELSASGSLEKFVSTTSMNVEPYSTGGDILRGVFELIYILMSLLYAAIEIYKIKLEVAAKKTEFMNDGLSINTGIIKMIWEGIKVHFSSFWNWMDFASIVLCFAIIGFWIRFISSTLVADGPSSSNLLQDLIETKLVYERYISACAINFLLVFIRLLKYLNRFERIALLSATFQSAKDDIFYFFVLLITVFFAFVIFGHVAFGSTHRNFSLMGDSVLACFFLLFGDLTIWFEIRETHPIEATFFFFLFTFMIIFILINMFIAIINNNYSENVEKLIAQKKENADEEQIHPVLQVWLKLKAMFRGIFDYCNKNRRIAKKFAGAEKSLKTTKDEVQIRFSEYNLNYKDSIKNKEVIDTEVLTDKEILGKLAEITKIKKTELRGALVFFTFVIVYSVTLIEQCQIPTKYMLVNTVRAALNDVEYEYQDSTYTLENIYNYECFLLWSKQFPTIFRYKITDEVYVLDNYLVGYNMTYVPEKLEAGPIRMTLRRAEMEDNPSSHYSDYQEKIRKNYFTSFSLTGSEDEKTFVGGYTGHTYKSDSGSSFMDLGGFVLYLSSDYVNFNEQIDYLASDLILNDTSVSIVYDFVLYNGNVNNVIYTAITFDFDSGGMIDTHMYIWPMDLQMYSTPRQIARAVFECVYILLLIYHIINTVIVLKADSENYSIWQRRLYEVLTDDQKKKRNEVQPEWLRRFFAIVDIYLFIDLLAYLFCILSLAAWIAYLSDTTGGPTLPEMDVGYFDSADSLARELKYYFDLSSVSLLLIFFSVLKYMRMSKSLSFLQSTINAALNDLYFFLIMLLTFLFGFVFMSYLAFGTHAESFSEITKALVTCFEMLVGNFDYQEMEMANESIAPFFFVLFLVLFVFVLLNIFVAILERAYSIVKQETEDEERDSPVKFLTVLIEFCVKKLRTQRDMRDYDNEEQVTILPEEVFVKLDTGLDGEQEPDSWALRFSEHILMERAKRSQVKSKLDILYKRRKTKEMEGRGFLIGNPARRAEKRARMQYWNYMRIGYQALRAQEKQIIRETKEIQEESKKLYDIHTRLQKTLGDLLHDVGVSEQDLVQLNKKEQKRKERKLEKIEQEP